ncbi:MAG: hypothetical protein ABSE07_08380 [Methanoregula sp.]|jgi:hypothetical protein
MNPKFIGDTKDLFKYDLITSIVKGFKGGIDRIVIVPMLTKYDPKFKGNPGCRNTNLIACFRRLRRTEDIDHYYDELKSYIKELKGDIKKEKVRVRVEKKEIFSQQNRGEYFLGIYENFPTSSLIFIDPDTGIKEKAFTEKHLSFAELKKLYELLDSESILMIYQHYQRRRLNSPDEPKRKFQDILTLTGTAPLVIADNTVMFMFLTKNMALYDTLTEILRNYARVEKVAAQKKNRDRPIDVIASGTA